MTVYTDITQIKRQEDMLRARSEELSGQLSAYSQELSTTNRKLASTISALEQSQQDLQEIEARTRLTTEMMPRISPMSDQIGDIPIPTNA